MSYHLTISYPNFERFTGILSPRLKTGQWNPAGKGTGKGAAGRAAAGEPDAVGDWPAKKRPRGTPKKTPAAKAIPFSAFGKTYLTQKSLDQAKASFAAKKEKDKGAGGKGVSPTKGAKKCAGKAAKTPPTKEWMMTQPCHYYSFGKCQRGAKCPWKH